MATHTPAPWKVFDAWQNHETVNFSRLGNNEDFVIRHNVFHDDMEAKEADLHLICAAPELLEALKFIVEQMSSPANKDHTLEAYTYGVGFDMAKKAITKAEGK